MILFLALAYVVIGVLLTEIYINSRTKHDQSGWYVLDMEYVLYVLISPLFIFFISPYIIYRKLSASKERIVENKVEYIVIKYTDGLVVYKNIKGKLHREKGMPAHFYINKKGDIDKSSTIIYALNGKESLTPLI